MTHPLLPTLTLAFMLPSMTSSALATAPEDPIAWIAQASAEDQLRFASLAVEEMRISVGEVSRWSERAEREDKEAALQCLSGKLATMRLLLGASEVARVLLQQALQADERGPAEHELRKIVVALGRIRRFEAEAEDCGAGPGCCEYPPIEIAQQGRDGADETGPQVLPDFGEPPPPTSPYR